MYEIVCENMVQSDRPQIAIKYGAEMMGFACRKTKKRFVFSTSIKIHFVKF